MLILIWSSVFFEGRAAFPSVWTRLVSRKLSDVTPAVSHRCPVGDGDGDRNCAILNIKYEGRYIFTNMI